MVLVLIIMLIAPAVLLVFIITEKMSPALFSAIIVPRNQRQGRLMCHQEDLTRSTVRSYLLNGTQGMSD
jgi:hypothetical protein